MKRIKYLLSIAVTAVTLSLAQAQVMPQVFQKGINVTNKDVSAQEVLEQITLTATQPGKVLVRFDGECTGSLGDRIILAASDKTTYLPNDGNVGVEARSASLNSLPFSHSRVYDITPGDHTFYALAHNYVEKEGDGKASVYGSLTVTYYPTNADGAFVEHAGIVQTNKSLDALEILGQVTINPTVAGKVKVSFDGLCSSSPGDRIVLAASDEAGWKANDGAVTAKAVSTDYNGNSFSHSRIYDVAAGTHTFYAVGQNYVDKDGDGVASVYGSLVVEFFPETAAGVTLLSENVKETNMDLTSLKTLKTLTLDAPGAGKVVVQFNGRCISSPGDRIVLASSDVGQWAANDGNVSVQAYSAAINDNSFSHTRVYDVAKGNATFYAVGQRYVDETGSGTASLYGTFTATYFPNEAAEVSIKETSAGLSRLMEMTPNPAYDQVNLAFPDLASITVDVMVTDMTGRVLLNWHKTSQDKGALIKINTMEWPAGCYLIRLQARGKQDVQKLIKI